MTPEQLFDRFVAHGTTIQKIAHCDPYALVNQIKEMRMDEPDEIELTDNQIAGAILAYARDAYEDRWPPTSLV